MAQARLIRTEIIHSEGKKRDIFELVRDDGSTLIYDEISDYVPEPTPVDDMKQEITDLKNMVSQMLISIQLLTQAASSAPTEPELPT